MKHWLINTLASLNHAAWRETKIERGHNGHEVNGYPYDLRKRWHELEQHHQDFDRAIARRMLRMLISFRFWIG